MKRVFALMLLSLIVVGTYAGDKVRGELRTEINGFQWYCYKQKEAYTIDGVKLFMDLSNIKKIVFSAVDKNDSGVFIIEYKKNKYNMVGAFRPTGEEINTVGENRKFTVEMSRVSLTFTNPYHKEYYTKSYIRNEYIKLYTYELHYDSGKEVAQYNNNNFFIKDNAIISGVYDIVNRMGVRRYDGKQIASNFEEITFQEEAKHFLCKTKLHGIEIQDRHITIIDTLGNTLADGVKSVLYSKDICKITTKDGEGLMTFTGKWIVKPEKGFTDYKTLSIGNAIFYKTKYRNSSKYNLISSEGIDVLGKEFDAIEIAGNNHVKVKSVNYYGVISLDGKEIIPTSRGYTYIGDYDSSKGTFAFTKKGYSGFCDAEGREISTTRLAPTADDIKANGSYASAVEIKNGSTKYYKVSKGSRYGLTDSEGKEIVPCEMEALESAGTGYLRYKLNGFWGVMNYTGNIIIPTDRGYTKIGDYVSFTKRFPYEMAGYKGECNNLGVQVSKIRVETPQQNVASNSSSSTTSSSNNSGNKTTTVVVEHQHTPQPVQEWQACFSCGGMGTMGCDNCGGSGTKYIGDRLHRCSRCNGRGIIPCNVCYGSKGQYVTVYK